MVVELESVERGTFARTVEEVYSEETVSGVFPRDLTRSGLARLVLYFWWNSSANAPELIQGTIDDLQKAAEKCPTIKMRISCGPCNAKRKKTGSALSVVNAGLATSALTLTHSCVPAAAAYCASLAIASKVLV